jgi:hypothetical protein
MEILTKDFHSPAKNNSSKPVEKALKVGRVTNSHIKVTSQ